MTDKSQATLPESERPRPHGDILDDAARPSDASEIASDRSNSKREPPPSRERDHPPGPTGDMDQPGMNPDSEGQD